MAGSRAKNILVIDDDITLLTAMRKMLERDFEVSPAKSAEMAWNILNNIQIDLILLDVAMPGVSGFDFMKYLQESVTFCYIPVIFVTAHGTPDVIMQAKSSGAKAFIVKPVSADVLLGKINTVLEEALPKTSRELLLKNVHLLEVACKSGKTADAEALAGDLAKIRYNPDTDALVAEICTNAINFEYAAAVEKINKLIKNNLFEKNKGGKADD